MSVLVYRKAADVRHDGLMKAAGKARKLLAYHPLNTRVLKPDGVQQPARHLGYARRGISEAGLGGRSLEGEAAETIYIVVFGKLVAVAEGPRGGDYRIIELDAAQIHIQPSHMISLRFMTGPSRQMRLFPVIVLQEQPMHAPKPQPMRDSKLNCPGTSAAL